MRETYASRTGRPVLLLALPLLCIPADRARYVYGRAKQYESYEHRPPASRARPSGSRQVQQAERKARRQLAYSKGYQRWHHLQEKRRVRVQEKARALIHRWEEEERVAEAELQARAAREAVVAEEVAAWEVQRAAREAVVAEARAAWEVQHAVREAQRAAAREMAAPAGATARRGVAAAGAGRGADTPRGRQQDGLLRRDGQQYKL